MISDPLLTTNQLSSSDSSCGGFTRAEGFMLAASELSIISTHLGKPMGKMSGEMSWDMEKDTEHIYVYLYHVYLLYVKIYHVYLYYAYLLYLFI